MININKLLEILAEYSIENGAKSISRGELFALVDSIDDSNNDALGLGEPGEEEDLNDLTTNSRDQEFLDTELSLWDTKINYPDSSPAIDLDSQSYLNTEL